MHAPGWLSLAQEASLPTLSVAALLLAVVAAIKVWPQLQQLRNEGDASLRKDLMDRVAQLEGRVRELEKLLGQSQAMHAAESQILRHELANESASFEALVLVCKTSPDRVAELLPEVIDLRERGKQRIALEKGAMAGAKVAAAGGGET